MREYLRIIVCLTLGLLAVLSISCENTVLAEETSNERNLMKEQEVFRQTRELASDYIRAKEYKKAIEAYQKIIEKFPGTSEVPSSLLHIGHIYLFNLKEYDKAIASYNKVIETSADERFIQTARGGLIQCYNALGNTDKVKDYLSKSLPLSEWAMGMRNLATLYVKKGNYDEGIRVLKEIIEKYPKTEEAATAHSSLVVIYRDKIKNYQKMLQECDNIINTYPKEQTIVFFALATKASTYSELKEYDKAIEVYQTIIKTYPNSDMAKHARAGLRVTKQYHKKGKNPSIEEAERIWKEEGVKEGGISIPVVKTSTKAQEVTKAKNIKLYLLIVFVIGLVAIISGIIAKVRAMSSR